MSADNGGPAFPVTDEQSSNGISATPGMSLRDYIAIKAMRTQPLFPSSLWQAVLWALGLNYRAGRFSPDEDAMQAYQTADAMLKARKL
jgi:hypothetical protein